MPPSHLPLERATFVDELESASDGEPSDKSNDQSPKALAEDFDDAFQD
jgi:hypothetical protein